jgi:protein-L-isoaspartate(D-aspartate) O-methyltransferase
MALKLSFTGSGSSWGKGMDRPTELAIVRRAYAKNIMFFAEAEDARVEAAFAAVPREEFLGLGPWPILFSGDRYVSTPSSDPLYLYTNVLVGLIPERHINNGQPSLHAALITSAMPKVGDHIVHIGAGVGYYTAIMAHLVGPSGRVTAVEFDPALAARAVVNFASSSNVRVVHGDGSVVSFETADVIYVNAGATRPTDKWLDGLSDGGRLILPLTTNHGPITYPPVPVERRGAVFRIERRGTEYLAQWISPVQIFPCEGVRDGASETALSAAFKKGGWQRVTRLYRHNDVPEEQCWVRAPGWCLAYG